jgi:hypothetical protein
MARIITARLEDDLEERYNAAEAEAPEENKSAVLRSVVADGLDAKDRDVLDAIGASDELRVAVEARRKEGEPLDDAARRLLREGTDASEDGPRTAADRAVNGFVVGIVTGVVAGAYAFVGPVGALVAVLSWASLVAFDDIIVRAVARLVDFLGTAEEIRDELEAARVERLDAEDREGEAATEKDTS